MFLFKETNLYFVERVFVLIYYGNKDCFQV